MQISVFLRKRIASRIRKSDTADYIKTELLAESMNLTVHDDLPDMHKPANFLGLPMFFLLSINFKHTSIGRLNYDIEGIAHDACTFDKNFKHF